MRKANKNRLRVSSVRAKLPTKATSDKVVSIRYTEYLGISMEKTATKQATERNKSVESIGFLRSLLVGELIKCVIN
jgi:hypothetical protein